jgi:cellulase/cellobiase CelA1
LINTKLNTPQTFKNKAPLSSTFFPKFVRKRLATISSPKSASSSSNKKSSSSSSSAPLKKKNARIKLIQSSSHAKRNESCVKLSFTKDTP